MVILGNVAIMRMSVQKTKFKHDHQNRIIHTLSDDLIIGIANNVSVVLAACVFFIAAASIVPLAIDFAAAAAAATAPLLPPP